MDSSREKLILLEDPITSLSKIIKIKPPTNYQHTTSDIPLRSLVKKELDSNYNTRNLYFYMLLNGKLFSANHIKWNQLESFNLVKIYFPLRGGSVVSSIIEGIINIGKFFMIFLQFIEWFVKFIAWLVVFINWVINIVNPVNIIKDFVKSIISISTQIVLLPLQAFMVFMKLSANKFLGGIFGSFWGWDNKAETSNDYKSKYYQEKGNQKKCYASDGKIPFSVLLGTIFCPPIGVFMELGLTGWFHILLATLLTFAYYVPGLLYALLVIYN